MIDVTLLGCGGMMPMKDRWLTSCLLTCDGRSVLIDCGEGTQIAMKCASRRVKPVELICFTHFHADHISGLPGFLLSMGNEGRTEPVTIAGPRGLERTVRSLCVIAPALPFEIRFAELKDEQTLHCGELEIDFFKARHSIECIGYSVSLKRQGKFDPEKAVQNNVPKRIWSTLQKNGEVDYEGVHYTFDMVGGKPRKGIKVSYCTDSRPTERIAEGVKESDLFICEGLYSEADKTERAIKTGHMMFCEAASLASKAGVRELWLTHFSPALTEPQEGLPAVREIFPNAHCGFDGKTVTLNFED